MPRTRNTQDYEQAVRELIGPRLKAARGRAGLSQKRLVEVLCETLTVKLSPPPLTQASLSNYESGKRSPDLWVTVLLCEALGMELSELVEGALDV